MLAYIRRFCFGGIRRSRKARACGARSGFVHGWTDPISDVLLYMQNLRITASAVFSPSIAAEVIPPAYPAPSPQG